MSAKPATADDYIAGFPPKVQKLLQLVRKTIRKNIPGASERISYGIIGISVDAKPVIYFAGHSEHIGIYPVPTDGTFAREFAKYKTSGKGSIQFLYDEPLPLDLIGKIAAYKLEEYKKRINLKQKKTLTTPKKAAPIKSNKKKQ